jgi:hypothetical protein
MASDYESVVSKHQALLDIRAFSLLLYRIAEHAHRVPMQAMRCVCREHSRIDRCIDGSHHWQASHSGLWLRPLRFTSLRDVSLRRNPEGNEARH